MGGRTYRIVVEGEISGGSVLGLNGMDAVCAGGTTTFVGYVRDQAELHGLLDRISDRGLTLLEARAVGDHRDDVLDPGAGT